MTDAITSSTVNVASSAAAAGAADTAISDAALADYDDFLTLLTTQLTNQDPLNPQDSTEFVEQIATFTTVEQQMNTNERLEELIAVTVEQQVADLAGWVGMEVSAPGLAYSYDGSELTFDPLVDSSAASAKAMIRDANGEVIAEIAYDPSSEDPLTWNGETSAGVQAERGNYFVEFEVTNLDDAGNPVTQSFTSSDFSRVAEARLVDEVPTLILDNGYMIDADQVTAVRAPT